MSETRKIAAILVADVVGYSRLAGADEDRILGRLRALRSDLLDPTVALHHGRVVKRTGDGILIEFRSVVAAERCAIEVQNGMAERNAGLPPERRIEFRIGIHLGDVVEEADGDLMGDGVNIAARLEGIAQQARSVSPRTPIVRSREGSTSLLAISALSSSRISGSRCASIRSASPQERWRLRPSVRSGRRSSSRVSSRGGLGRMVCAPAQDPQPGRAACASDNHGRARLVAQSDVAIAHNHLRGHSSRAGQSLAIGLGRPPGGRYGTGS